MEIICFVGHGPNAPWLRPWLWYSN